LRSSFGVGYLLHCSRSILPSIALRGTVCLRAQSITLSTQTTFYTPILRVHSPSESRPTQAEQELSRHVESMHHFRVVQQAEFVTEQSSFLLPFYEGDQKSEKRKYLSRPLEDIHWR
jgi:hypothetical protein